MKAKEFCQTALTHYRVNLAKERDRFGILGISDTYVEHNSHVVYNKDHAGSLWEDLSKQSGLYLHVGGVHSQLVFAILSKEEVPHPVQLYELWALTTKLAKSIAGLQVKDCPEKDIVELALEELDLYDGPYKLEIPAEVMDECYSEEC